MNNPTSIGAPIPDHLRRRNYREFQGEHLTVDERALVFSGGDIHLRRIVDILEHQSGLASEEQPA